MSAAEDALAPKHPLLRTINEYLEDKTKFATIAVKTCITGLGIAGVGCLIMGLGFIPIDPEFAAVAKPNIDPFGIPLRPFMLFLGPMKVLGAASQWGYGPLHKGFGRLGLQFCCICGFYGHYNIDPKSVSASIIMFSLLTSLYWLDPLSNDVEHEGSKSD